jgi:hypothetical protein
MSGRRIYRGLGEFLTDLAVRGAGCGCAIQ